MTTYEWIAVFIIACGPLLAFLIGAELASRHDRRVHDEHRRRTS